MNNEMKATLEPPLDLLLRARALLDAETPLSMDCGRLCDAACCREANENDAEPADPTGMLLFPGEEALYADPTRWHLTPLVDWPTERFGRTPILLTCTPPCARDQRPLACRIFPLTPYLRDGRLTIRMDRRARAMCPLADSGKSGLAPSFVRAVSEAMALLDAAEPFHRHIGGLTWLIDQHAL